MYKLLLYSTAVLIYKTPLSHSISPYVTIGGEKKHVSWHGLKKNSRSQSSTHLLQRNQRLVFSMNHGLIYTCLQRAFSICSILRLYTLPCIVKLSGPRTSAFVDVFKYSSTPKSSFLQALEIYCCIMIVKCLQKTIQMACCGCDYK